MAAPSLNGKVGPIPKKPLVLVLGVVVAFLVYRHFKGSQTTSAGSGATPSPSQTLPPSQGDSTGGGASGSSSPNDVFGPLFGQLFSLASGDQSLAAQLASNPPTNTTTTNNTTTNNTYGGNISTPTSTAPKTETTPTTSFPTDPEIFRSAEIYTPGTTIAVNKPTVNPPTSEHGQGGGYTPGTPLSASHPTPQPARTPQVSGYDQRSKANLH